MENYLEKHHIFWMIFSSWIQICVSVQCVHSTYLMDKDSFNRSPSVYGMLCSSAMINLGMGN